MITKRIIGALLVLTIITSCFRLCIAIAEEKEINVFLNGNSLYFDVPPIIVDGRALVPMRKIFEELGYTVDWNETKQRVTAVKGERSVQLDIGDTLVILDNYESAAELDVPAQIMEGRTMVPLRFVAEVANYDVLWDGNSKTVYIEAQTEFGTIVREDQPIATAGDNLFYYKEDNKTYKFALNGSVFEEATQEEVESAFPVNVGIDSSKEALGNDFLRIGECLYYKDSTWRLIEFNHITGEKKIINEKFTIGFDIGDGKVYFTSADYSLAMSSWPPKSYNGVFCYNPKTMETAKILDAPAFDVKVGGSNLYYTTNYEGQGFDLHRYRLDGAYDIQILVDLNVGTFWLCDKYIFFYKKGGIWQDDTPEGQQPQLYMGVADGGSFMPVLALMFESISWSHINGDIPDGEHFDEYLTRDIESYFSGKGQADYILLRKSPSQAGTGYPHYYVWVTVTDEIGNTVTEGAARLNAIEKEGFAVTDFITKAQILDNNGIIERLFPLILHKRILELAEL